MKPSKKQGKFETRVPALCDVVREKKQAAARAARPYPWKQSPSNYRGRTNWNFPGRDEPIRSGCPKTGTRRRISAGRSRLDHPRKVPPPSEPRRLATPAEPTRIEHDRILKREIAGGW